MRVSDRSLTCSDTSADRGIVIGAKLRVASVSAAASAITVQLDGEDIELALDAAEAIRIVPDID